MLSAEAQCLFAVLALQWDATWAASSATQVRLAVSRLCRSQLCLCQASAKQLTHGGMLAPHPCFSMPVPYTAGRMGLMGNLTPGQIVEQVVAARRLLWEEDVAAGVTKHITPIT